MDDTYKKILDDLHRWRAFIDAHPPLRQMIADTRAMTGEARTLDARLSQQRDKLISRFGAPAARTIKGLQLKGRKSPPDDDDDSFGAAWPGADAVLARAREKAEGKGIEIDDGLAALIKYTDRVVKSAAKPADGADGGDNRTAQARREIKKMTEPGERLVALVFALNAYLSRVLALQVFERRDADFRAALKADGIDDVSKVILGGLADGLPFAGVTYGFVTAMTEFEDARTEDVADATACMEFLKVLKLQLHLWKSGATRHAAIADELLA